MIVWYRILFLPLLLITAPYYIYRMLKRGGYAQHWHHRLGCIGRQPKKTHKKRLWIQAVSVGEVNALQAVVEQWMKNDVELVITTTTSTGYQRARQLFADKVLTVAYFPLDFWPFSRLAWRSIRPDAIVLMESELWPEHIHQARIRRVPVFLINARLSERSFCRYQYAPWLFRKLVKNVHILASSENDYKKFLALGADPLQTHCVGNLKLDTHVHVLDQKEKLSLKQSLGLGTESLVLVGASTWPGEEMLLLESVQSLRARGLDVRLLLIPRHAERRHEVIEILESFPFTYNVRTHHVAKDTVVYLADTTGELARLAQTADVAFIGKSIPPNVGGQSPVELAAAALPIVYGPNMSNFKTICQTLENAGGAAKVDSISELKQVLEHMLTDPAARGKLGAHAQCWYQQHRGACAKVTAHVGKNLF